MVNFYSVVAVVVVVMFNIKPVLMTAQSLENISRATFSYEVIENSPLYFSKSPQNLFLMGKY